MMATPWLKQYQDRAHRMGLYPGAGDGEYGPNTEKALDAVFAIAEKARGIQPPAYPHLPSRYRFLLDVSPMPLIVHEGLRTLGTVEVPGAGDSPTIMAWKRELLAAGIDVRGYSGDAVAWCGLLAAITALRARKDLGPVGNVLWARNWLKFGIPVDEPMLGDYAIWPRGNGGHVNIVIALDEAGYVHGLGGNQSDAVNIMRKHRSDALGFRRPKYRNQPPSVKQYIVEASGKISVREA